MSKIAFLALTGVVCLTFFLHGLWILRRTTVPGNAWYPRWMGEGFRAMQLRHMKTVARVHVIGAPIVFLAMLALLGWIRFGEVAL